VKLLPLTVLENVVQFENRYSVAQKPMWTIPVGFYFGRVRDDSALDKLIRMDVR